MAAKKLRQKTNGSKPADIKRAQLACRDLDLELLNCTWLVERAGDPDAIIAIRLSLICLRYARVLLGSPTEAQKREIRNLYAAMLGAEGPRANSKTRELIVDEFEANAAGQYDDQVTARMVLSQLSLRLRHDSPLVTKLRDEQTLELASALVVALRKGNAVESGKKSKALLKHLGVGGTIYRVRRTKTERQRQKK